MPAMLGFFSLQFPAGVLIYWVATNLWTMGQQWFIFRRIDDTVPPPPDNEPKPGRPAGASREGQRHQREGHGDQEHGSKGTTTPGRRRNTG